LQVCKYKKKIGVVVKLRKPIGKIEMVSLEQSTTSTINRQAIG